MSSIGNNNLNMKRGPGNIYFEFDVKQDTV